MSKRSTIHATFTLDRAFTGGDGHQARVHGARAFLDGFDDPGAREKGTRDLLDTLGASLERERPAHVDPARTRSSID